MRGRRRSKVGIPLRKENPGKFSTPHGHVRAAIGRFESKGQKA